MGSGLIYDGDGSDITMSIADDMVREYPVHYRGNRVDTEYVAGLRANNRTVMRAIEATYDAETDVTTITFMQEDDPMWRNVLQQEEWAKKNMHVMYPAFFRSPR
jgi:hypothetical protein